MNSADSLLLSDLVQNYIEQAEKIGEFKAPTIKKYKQYQNNLYLYLDKRHLLLHYSNATIRWAEDFKVFIKKTKKLKRLTYASRHIEFFKIVLDRFAYIGVIPGHQLNYYKAQRDKNDPPVYLTPDELIELMKFTFHSKILSEIKDLYLFQVASGVSYSDIWSSYEIVNTDSGTILQGRRKKNDQLFFTPYDEIIDIILRKYNGNLPRYPNATYNRILKEIAGILGIKKNLTTHTGRKTFAMLKDSEGWTRETVALMLGHKSIRTTEKYYLHPTPSRLLQEMKNRA